MSHYLVTGGAGFIGSNFARYLMKHGREHRCVVLDKLTYAGRKENLDEIKDDPRFTFVKGDIADPVVVEKLFEEHRFDVVVNFAAETHVDRSIESPGQFITTDVYGTFVLLEAARKFATKRFIQISTDEVYGSIAEGSFTEEDQLKPSNPYSASKAGADRLAYSYYATYQLPVIITRCSNNYGPNQYPEKFISLFITNALEGKPLPLYGDGKNIRDWIYVEDHVEAVLAVIEKGTPGEVYNIGAGQEIENLDVAKTICRILGYDESQILLVRDRLGHDRRYSLSFEKIKKLGWSPRENFASGIEKTILWYRVNESWWRVIKSGEYREYYERMYGGR